MSLPAARHIRPDEYLAFERLADIKHEYVSGVVYPRGDPDHPVDPEVVLGLRPESRTAMAGGTEIHSAVKVNLTIALEFSAIYKDVVWGMEIQEADE